MLWGDDNEIGTEAETETGTATETQPEHEPEPTPVAFFFQSLRSALGFLSGNKLKMGGNSGSGRGDCGVGLCLQHASQAAPQFASGFAA